MDDTATRPTAYALVYERSSQKRVLHISSSVREVIYSEPYELVDYPPPQFIPDIGYIAKVTSRHGLYTGGNVILGAFYTKRTDDISVYVRTTAFTCGDVYLGLVTTFTSADIDPDDDDSLHTFDIILEENNDEHEQLVFDRLSYTNRHGFGGNGDSPRSGGDKEIVNSVINMIYSVKTASQACVVLRFMDSTDGAAAHGPQIAFSSVSISTVISANPRNLQGVPFLTLIPIHDIVKATVFLDSIIHSDDVVYESLSLLTDPLAERRQENPGCVSVESMGMRTDDGIMLLLQLQRPNAAGSSGSRRSGGFLSLKDILSSEPETPSFPREWRRM